MINRHTLAISLVLLVFVAAEQAKAQDAAETAIILGGTAAAQTKGQRALGAAVSGSIGRAANAVNAAQRGGNGGRQNSGKTRAARGMIMLPGNVDPLEHTDASTFKLANGSSIRVSGHFQPSGQTSCEKNCAAQ